MRIAFAVLLFCTTSLFADTYALKGTLVTPDEVIENGILLVRDDRIVDAGANVTLPAGVTPIETNGFIYPGLIDLHNHITWNAQRRWSPGTLLRNRYEWQAMDSYVADLAAPRGIEGKSVDCDLERFGEVKALAWGATSITGSLAKDCSMGLARNADFRSGLETDAQYRVFPFELNERDDKSMREALANKRPVIAHVAEGIDASAAREVRMASARGFLVDGFIVIHGVPLTESDYKVMQANHVGMVWSPRSNISLYGKTADYATAKKYVTLAISPDWSPSGSNGMIEELRYAARLTTVFTPKELVQMATSNPAKLLKTDRIGRLAPGTFADYLVVRRTERTDAYETLVWADLPDVALVAVNGRPLYGDAALLTAVNPSALLETVDICGMTKSVDTTDSGVTWADTMRNLRRAFGAIHVGMAGFADACAGIEN